MLLLLVLLCLFLVFGGGYWGRSRWPEDGGTYRGTGIGLGGVLLILLVLYVLGYFPR